MNGLRIMLLAIPAAMLGACASGGGMYPQPYALFEPDQRSAVEDTRPAYVLRIDGTNVSINESVPVPAGLHTLDVSIPGMPGMSNPDRDTILVDAKPCTLYFLSARRSSRSASDWKAFVSSSEPIGECVKRFPATK